MTHDTRNDVHAETASGDVERIRAGIERTQADLVETVSELQRKLSPSHMYSRVKESARSTVRTWQASGMAAASTAVEGAQGLARLAQDRARTTPAPAAFIGAGVAAGLYHWIDGRRRASKRRQS